MSDKEAKDLIAGALEILADEKNWVKGVEDQTVADEGMNVREQSCLWGALKRASHPGYYQLPYSRHLLNEQVMMNAAVQIGTVIREQYPDRVGKYDADGAAMTWKAIMPFNDHPATAHSEVIAVLEKSLMR